MSQQPAQEREIREIAIAANSGEATDEQIARLDVLIRSDRHLANYAARMLDQQASLAWQGSMGTWARQQKTSSPAGDAVRSTPAAQEFRAQRASWTWATMAVGIGFILGGLSAAIIYRSVRPETTAQVADAADTKTAAPPTYEARLVGSTACLWDGNSVGSREIGSWLTSGESMHLLEGLAQFELQWGASGSAKLSLEGPAAMMLNTDGMPTLRFGRLTATIRTSYRPFVLETSVGRVVLDEYGSIGVSAFGNEGEIHVFNGTAILEPAWRTSDQDPEPLRIEAGQALHIQPGENGQPSIARHSADPDYFAAQVSMSSDGLAIPPGYVQAVKNAKPIGYWRFDREKWPQVPNVMGSGLDCQVTGAVGRTIFHGNQSVDFGVTDEDGAIVSNQAIDKSISNSYSIEFWVKPSHYHVGAVISLVGDKPMPNGILPHGMLIELGGTGKIPTAVQHPGCIRFLHRSPASDSTSEGTSCYSKSPYTLRKWQHVVATKDGADMRLFVNGELAAEGADASDLPSGLRLLVGRLYPAQGGRRFIGQLDELALYNRALKAEEIAQHYELVRPKTASRHDI